LDDETGMIKQSNLSGFKEKFSRVKLNVSWSKLLDLSIQSDIPTDQERYGELK